MADEVNPWMRTAFDQPKISRDAERDLLTKIRAGDRTALTALMISQFKTVFFIAKRYEGMGFDLEDLVQEGFAGLLQAIKKFNSDRGCCLATYASHWIMVSITRALTSKGHLVRLPVYAQALLYRITKTSNLLSEQLHRAPTDEELAERTGVDINKMRSFQQCWRPTVSLDERFSDEDSGSEDGYGIFADPATVYDRTKEETLHKIDLLMKILDDNVLTPRERAILNSRFGLGAEQSQTLTAIGKRYRVTRERIRQIETHLLQKLRKHIQQAEARAFMTPVDRALLDQIKECTRTTPDASPALAETANT